MARNTLVGWDSGLGDPTHLILLRHGQTPHTREKRFSGGTGRGGDPGLTDVGRRQASAAADWLHALHQHTPIDAVIASPMVRTRQTADAIANRLRLAVEIDEGFRECDFGEWDGLTYAEVQERSTTELASWFSSTNVAPPGGESFRDVGDRLADTHAGVMERHAGRTLVVVTHVTPIKSLVRQILEASPDALFRMELAPASITWLSWYADGAASMRAFNHTAHLDGLV